MTPELPRGKRPPPAGSGLDLIIGPGIVRAQLDAALSAVFSLRPEAIGNLDTPAPWRSIRSKGWALIDPLPAPGVPFSASVDGLGAGMG